MARSVERLPVVGRWTAPAIGRVRTLRRRRARGDDPLLQPMHVARNVRTIEVSVAPDAIDEPDRRLRAVGGYPPEPPTLDIELFEALNAEYAAKPLVPVAPSYEHDAILTRSVARLQRMHRAIDLADKRVLVFGCGAGYEAWFLGHAFGSEAWGIDVVERRAWASLQGPRVHFELADIVRDAPFEAASFDRIVSTNVFEHVEHPQSTIGALHRVLRPGGLAYITANLHRGPKASHRYREVTFPWPHLVFPDEVFREFYRRRGQPPEPAVWVNTLTWEQYRDAFRAAGFTIRAARFREVAIDEAFYRRFAWILGRYPRADLQRDFFDVVLEKPQRP